MLCGTLNPHSSAKVGAYFAYSKGANCTGGSIVPAEAEKEEGQNIKVSGEAFGLQPSTEYTYCVVATNESGETFGQPLTFTTPPATQEPKTEAATAITSTSAILEGTLEPTGATLKYAFKSNNGTSCEGGNITSEAEGENKVSAKVEGLVPNTEYTFCLVAKSIEGGTAIGKPEKFRTQESQIEIEAKAKLEQEAKAKAKAEAEATAKAETEAAAAAKKQQEQEAAAAQKTKESEFASKSVSLTIVKVKVSPSSVTITLAASQQGTITISGSGLKTTTKSVAAGCNQIKVALTKAGKNDRKHHKKVKITVQLKAAGKAVSGSRMIKL